MFNRSSGILMHISSLPSAYGIGDFGIEAYKFVDFLKEADQKLWQVLPLGPTGYGDSPYQSFSTFAGNPYFIDLDALIKEKLLTEDDVKDLKSYNTAGTVDFGMIYHVKFPILKKAYDNFVKAHRMIETKEFQEAERHWLADYALFMTLKEMNDGKNWSEWSHEYKNRDRDALKNVVDTHTYEIGYYVFLQYMFFTQWKKLKEYANSKGIKIIGDVPIYISSDSSDAWANSEMLMFDENKNSTKVAGCPPDQFSADGQLWGNPLYNWDYMEKTGYAWWIKRVEACFKLHDIVRIDHFRGLESYWAIPAGSATAAPGAWEQGPGMKLINAINNALGKKDIIAEDLGFLTPEVKKLLDDSGYPGMKILLFAFESREESDYLPHKYPENSVAYTGTHDNETVVGWHNTVVEHDRKNCDEYLSKMEVVKSDEINWKFIEAVWSTKSVMVLTQTQDLLGLDNSARMNTPSTASGNWQWRLKGGELTSSLAKRLGEVTHKNGR